MQYLQIPKLRITLGSTVGVDGFLTGSVELTENAYWIANLTFRNSPALYPTIADVGSNVLVEVHDNSATSPWNSGNYVTLFSGTILFPDYTFSGDNILITFQCVGQGYALNMMNVAEEYGTQSRNATLDTISSIITDTSVGIIPKYVNKYKGGTKDSGYSITTTNVESLIGTVPFINFPWKPADKCIDDLCDLNTALNAGTYAGPHWIVDNAGKLRIKRIGASQTGWTKYYGNSSTNATLVSRQDFFDGDFQPVKAQANTIYYYGTWRRPSSGDYCEGNPSDFGTNNSYYTWTDDATYHAVGTKGVRCTGSNSAIFQYPKTLDANWDFSSFTDYNTPSLNLYLLIGQAMDLTGGLAHFYIRLCNSTGGYFYVQPGDTVFDKYNEFRHFSYPIGPGAGNNGFLWQTFGTVSWSKIDYIEIWFPFASGGYATLDGMHFGAAPLLRVARQEFPDEISAGRGTLGTTANPIRFRVLTDKIAKDDSLSASDDSGLMAQMAKAELLRLCSTLTNGKFTTPLIPDVLPGQYLYISSKDWRITKITHDLAKFQTKFEVTDDLTNSHQRLRYEDKNRVEAAIRPEYQDRQASAIKSGDMDIHIAPLEKAYNI